MLLAGRVAVVTGAASGLGRQIALTFAAEGARLAAVDRTVEAGEELLEELRTAGQGAPLFVRADVSSASEVAQAFAQIVGQTGQVDVLVNSAGVREIGDPLTLPTDEWDHVIAINLSGTFYCCQAAAREMVESGGGSIVNVASVAGLVGFAKRPAYTAAKHGVIGLTKSLARDLSASKIRVNALCPGLIRTPLTEPYFHDQEFVSSLPLAIPQGTCGRPHHVAQAALFLASDMAEYVTGIALPVDGGFTAEKTFDLSGKTDTPFVAATLHEGKR